MPLPTITIRRIRSTEEKRFQELMQSHHYLGALPKIGNTIWYVAVNEEEWLALLSFSLALFESLDLFHYKVSLKLQQ